MTLRRANRNDLPFLLRLERRFCDLGMVGSDDAKTHERHMADSDCLYFIVEEEGEPGGYAILRGLTSANRCIELKRLVVARPGQGLGRQVLRAILDVAFRTLSAHRLWLDVYDENLRARHVYRSQGFTEEGTLRDCIRCSDRYRSLVVMSILESEYREAVARPHAGSAAGLPA